VAGEICEGEEVMNDETLSEVEGWSSSSSVVEMDVDKRKIIIEQQI
jgi:hypothetical protein